ncbi:MAG: tryptophan--tRNA ligase, partial [Candidatus Diapherotrites archaeon]|nr:tryptophan--tRNA ligase [Candidatus Diapherotrites archaeon]
EEHRRLGGVLEVDKVYELLLFHYPNDEKLAAIAEDFTSGKMLSGEMKQIAIDFFKETLAAHQAKAEENKKLAREIVLGK